MLGLSSSTETGTTGAFHFPFFFGFYFFVFLFDLFGFFFFADLLLAGAPAQHEVGDTLGEEALSYCARVTSKATAAAPCEQAPALRLYMRCMYFRKKKLTN